MSRSTVDSREVTKRGSRLTQIAGKSHYDSTADAKPASTSELDNLLEAINDEITDLLRMDASDTPDRVVTIGASTSSTTETSRKHSIANIRSLLPSFSSGTITFPATAGTVTVSPGDNTSIVIGNSEFVKCSISLDASGNLVVMVGTPNAVEASAAAPQIPNGTRPIGYITVETDGSGNIQNIVQSKLSQSKDTRATLNMERARLIDTSSSTLPSSAPLSIDGGTVATGDLVLFTNLSSGNNKIYEATVSGGSVTWAARSISPSRGDSIYIIEGTLKNKTLWFFTLNDAWEEFVSGGGSGGGLSYQFVAETPVGDVDSLNTDFEISHDPISSVIVTINGLIRRLTDDFTITGTTISFVSAPDSGSDVFVFYGTEDRIMQETGTGDGSNQYFVIPQISNDLLVSVDGVLSKNSVEFKNCGGLVEFLSGNIPGVGQELAAYSSGNGQFSQQTLSGTVNGSNKDFTFSAGPTDAGAVIVCLNGVVQVKDVDYTISGATVSFTDAPIVGQVPYGIRYNG